MKICIWCKKDEVETTFNRVAHTIPQSLGGKNICVNVCDICNSYFGSPQNKKPSIEVIIKEAFLLSKLRLLGPENVGKNKIISKYSSEYFKLDLVKFQFDIKMKWKFHAHFLETLGRQFKRGIYKMYLEELERQFGGTLDPKYDFIREFSRYDIGDYPVFYFKREIIPIINEHLENPQIHFKKVHNTYVHDSQFFEFDLFGHVLGIATSRNYEITIDSYLKKTIEAKREFYTEFKEIVKFNDFDITLSVFDKK